MVQKRSEKRISLALKKKKLRPETTGFSEIGRGKAPTEADAPHTVRLSSYLSFKRPFAALQTSGPFPCHRIASSPLFAMFPVGPRPTRLILVSVVLGHEASHDGVSSSQSHLPPRREALNSLIKTWGTDHEPCLVSRLGYHFERCTAVVAV